MTRVEAAFLRPYRIQLARPLGTAHGELVERRGFLFFLATGDGRYGVGEAAPLPSHATEDLRSCEATLRAAWPRLVHCEPAEARRDLDALVPAFADAPAARCAASTALLDLDACGAGVGAASRLAELGGRRPARDVPVNALL
ncbi:MAG TPA: o-succinylbenzoate synthase, partial [Candidatus Thermoplasmatota archaeon]|nr:o-succinylbenzoate synthase [Candidatus Thermoplasmatota archaeon]